MMLDDEHAYRQLLALYPRADRRDLLDALAQATRAATTSAVKWHLLVRVILARWPAEMVERLELELMAQRVEAEEAVRAALRRAAQTNGPEPAF
jgi:hypothetical protein